MYFLSFKNFLHSLQSQPIKADLYNLINDLLLKIIKISFPFSLISTISEYLYLIDTLLSVSKILSFSNRILLVQFSFPYVSDSLRYVFLANSMCLKKALYRQSKRKQKEIYANCLYIINIEGYYTEHNHQNQ